MIAELTPVNTATIRVLPFGEEKQNMLISGMDLLDKFCKLNMIEFPKIVAMSKPEFKISAITCAYYRPFIIRICPPVCAHLGRANQAWSWPGYVIDRTPHGVLAHELGHHVDRLAGNHRHLYWSEVSTKIREASGGELRLTKYMPPGPAENAEWFAEMFRLFVTNPDLLCKVRPLTYRQLVKRWSPCISAPWHEVLAGAPQRTIDMCEQKIRIGGTVWTTPPYLARAARKKERE